MSSLCHVWFGLVSVLNAGQSRRRNEDTTQSSEASDRDSHVSACCESAAETSEVCVDVSLNQHKEFIKYQRSRYAAVFEAVLPIAEWICVLTRSALMACEIDFFVFAQHRISGTLFQNIKDIS